VSAFFDLNFAKACGVYGQLWQSFLAAIQTLPKLGGINGSALPNRAAFGACNKVMIS